METDSVRDSAQQQPFLLVTHGGWVCALPVSEIVEVLRPLPVEALPGAPRGVLGLSMVRGQPLPVVGLGAILGPGGEEKHGRFVVLNLGARRAVLGVESVLGIRRLSLAGLQDVPPLLREANPDVVAGIAGLDRTLLLLLQAARMVPLSLWEALDAQAQAQP